jgi:hypothetical protein
MFIKRSLIQKKCHSLDALAAILAFTLAFSCICCDAGNQRDEDFVKPLTTAILRRLS